jgi:recombination endonuclease VII
VPPGGKVIAKPAKPACKDCKRTTRALSKPGPRCASCWRTEENKRKERTHGQYVEKTYGISAEDYKKLYEAQGGRCAICKRATGAARRLAVDHDHKTGEVRGLLCKPCNRYGLGMFARDDPEIFDRAADYLRNPPARKILRNDETDR